MTIGEIVRQGFHYARTCRSLWLFGFVVGIASGGSSGGGRGDGVSSVGASGISLSLSSLQASTEFALIAAVALVAVVTLTVLRLIGEAALIDGVVRARQGRAPSTGEGFRAGWAHWGVLLRITLLYVAFTIGSVALLVVPCVIAVRAIGPTAGILLAVPALIVAVPCLVTLYLVQAFAWRIAVLENRHALDAISKARLFLHGRLLHGLKLMVAAFLGSLVIGLIGVACLAPLGFTLVALMAVLPPIPVLVLGCAVLLPLLFVLAAVLGTFRSSVWTIGYVTQVES